MYLIKNRSCLEAEKMCELSVWRMAAVQIRPRHQEISRWESYYNEKQSCDKNWIIQRLYQETLYLEGLTSCLSPVSPKGPPMWNRRRVFTTTTYPHMWVFAWYPHRWELSFPRWGLLSRAKRQFSQWSLDAVTSWQNISESSDGLWTCRESTSLSITSSPLNVTDVSDEKGMEGGLWSTLPAPCVVSLYSAVHSWLLWEAIKM